MSPSALPLNSPEVPLRSSQRPASRGGDEGKRREEPPGLANNESQGRAEAGALGCVAGQARGRLGGHPAVTRRSPGGQRLSSAVGTAKAQGERERGTRLLSPTPPRPQPWHCGQATAPSNDVGSEWPSAPPRQPPPAASPHGLLSGRPAPGLASRPPSTGAPAGSMTPLSWPRHQAGTSPGRSPQLREARWGVSTTRPHSPALALKHQGVRQALTVLPSRRSRPPMTFPPLRRPQPAWTPPRHVHTSTFLPP